MANKVHMAPLGLRNLSINSYRDEESQETSRKFVDEPRENQTLEPLFKMDLKPIGESQRNFYFNANISPHCGFGSRSLPTIY